MHRRASRASRVLLLASLTVAVSATLFFRGHLARLEARAATGGDLVTAVVAASALPRGTPLGPGSVRLARLLEAALPPGAIRSLAAATGRSLAADVLPGEVLTTARLSAGGPVAAVVPPGSRGVAVPVAMPPGAVITGDRVDVLATFVSGSPHTETVAREAEVLRVDAGSSGDGATGAITLFLAVSPGTAERLAFAGTFGELSVAVAPG
jgi:Flp pilus assembly protein CpaB